jgi:very-short-patch-repair endonuclease
VERRLWALLRNNQLGCRFRRRHPIGPYIVDFFSPGAKLVIELDGDQHGTDSGSARDALRTEWMEKRGYRVLRISNAEFLKNSRQAMDRICLALGPLPQPPLALDPQGEGGMSSIWARFKHGRGSSTLPLRVKVAPAYRNRNLRSKFRGGV